MSAAPNLAYCLRQVKQRATIRPANPTDAAINAFRNLIPTHLRE